MSLFSRRKSALLEEAERLSLEFCTFLAKVEAAGGKQARAAAIELKAAIADIDKAKQALAQL